MSNTDWLKDLKEGYKVFVDCSRYGGTNLNLTTVKKITPKGHIRTQNGKLFKNGSHRIDSYNDDTLKQWTQEREDNLRAKAYFNKLAHAINAVDARTLTPEQVQKIYDIIKANEE